MKKRKDHKTIYKKIQSAFLRVCLSSNIIIGLIGIIAIIIIGGKLLESNLADKITFIFVLASVAAFIVIFVLLAIGQSKQVALKISKPINQLAEYADSIANGNININIDIYTGDEIDDLANDLKTIVQSFKLMKSDVDMIVSEALEGSLDKHADISMHKGSFREIIESLNAILDAVKAPLEVAFPFINNLANGVRQKDIDNVFKGHFAKLSNDLNEVRHSLAVLLAESQKLEKAGLSGELDVRGDESQLKGFYADTIRGINNTFDAIKEPLDVASVFINILAEGGFQNDIENTYKGYYASLVGNLNHARQSLHILVDESSKLKVAAKNGDLSFRGDTSKLKGSYADIIDGFNQTLESISIPLNESFIMLEKMTQNDYTIQMSQDYKGVLYEFSVSLNAVRERLLAVENVFKNIAKGDLSLLEQYKNIGKRSENDNIIPSLIDTMQSVSDLIKITSLFVYDATEGNLDNRADESKFEGGYREIVKGLNETMQAISAPIKETSQILQKLSEGDLTVEVKGDYKGEYNYIKQAMNQAITSFNVLLNEIKVAASQVSAGSKQVSDASQSLSQGATEQASSIEELTSSIAEISIQTKQNAADASRASLLSTTVQTQAVQGNEKMYDMLVSMRDINDSSMSISKIIKVIDDIAFQTNILALNAAVEAARAGQNGKGFAVVADEVRNLAAKSAQAAKSTTALIEGSIKKVEVGTKIANETAEVLNTISESIKKTTVLVGNIASSSNEQATAISQIDQGITQVSTVVQMNSATAEESAASSEELSGQADMLLQLVSGFNLKDVNY